MVGRTTTCQRTEHLCEAGAHLGDLILGHCVHHPVTHSVPEHNDTARESPVHLGSEVTSRNYDYTTLNYSVCPNLM